RFTGGGLDGPDQLRELLAPSGVLGRLLVLDGRPLAVSRHGVLRAVRVGGLPPRPARALPLWPRAYPAPRTGQRANPRALRWRAARWRRAPWRPGRPGRTARAGRLPGRPRGRPPATRRPPTRTCGRGPSARRS